MVKNLLDNAGDSGDVGLILGSGRSPGGGNGNPVQYSCPESHGQRSPAGYSPGGGKELDTTECTHTHERRVKSGMLPGKRCSLIVGTCGSCQAECTAHCGAYTVFVYAFCPAQPASFQDPQPAKPCPASKSQFTCTPSSTLQTCSVTLG